MRISDWSSDVCSSDLSEHSGDARTPEEHQGAKVSHISAKARRVSVSYHPEADRAVSDTKATASAISFSRAAMGTREKLYASTACPSRDRKSVGSGKSGSVRVDLGGGRNIKKTN